MGRKQKSVRALSRRDILKYGLYGGLAVGLSPGLWLGGCGDKRGEKRPNVILIVLDTARADRFSCLGYERKTSPNIDGLASQGIVYERAYTTNFWTLPSHASLFTGLYPSQAGATSETLQLPLTNTTLAEMLKEASYDTAPPLVVTLGLAGNADLPRDLTSFMKCGAGQRGRKLPRLNRCRNWLQ